MARIRTIKPEITTSESMGKVSREARLLFLLLFTIVDDVGRTRAASRMLASLLYPYDTDDAGLPAKVDGWLAELARENCVRLYEVDGAHYLEIVNWLKHQKIDHPSKSKLPGPSDMFAKPREEIAEPRASRARGLDLGPRTKEVDQEGEGSAREQSREPRSSPSSARPRDDWPDDYREQFAESYPNKVHMAAGLKALEEARSKGAVSWRVVISTLASYAAKDDDRPWMNPKTWIEQERWNDRPAAATRHQNGGNRPRSGDTAARLAREAEERERSAGAALREGIDIGGTELGGDDALDVSRTR